MIPVYYHLDLHKTFMSLHTSIQYSIYPTFQFFELTWQKN